MMLLAGAQDREYFDSQEPRLDESFLFPIQVQADSAEEECDYSKRSIKRCKPIQTVKEYPGPVNDLSWVEECGKLAAIFVVQCLHMPWFSDRRASWRHVSPS
jgi:hypothetical protein